MKKAYVFPGQGAQFEGMGKDLYGQGGQIKEIFDQADDILGFGLSTIMFEGSADDLKQTKVTQPALFVHSLAKFYSAEVDQMHGAAGHSLGEFSALVAAGCIGFEEGLRLVYARAMAMQKCCEVVPGTMAAVLGLADDQVEEICKSIDNEVVVAANYNCPGQLVISGSIAGIDLAAEKLKAAGAKRVLVLPVGGAFHSPLMAAAQEELGAAISSTDFSLPTCPVYQNFSAVGVTDPAQIKANLLAQLTGPVKWTQSIQMMVSDGIEVFIESGGTGKVLAGLIKKIATNVETQSL